MRMADEQAERDLKLSASEILREEDDKERRKKN